MKPDQMPVNDFRDEEIEGVKFDGYKPRLDLIPPELFTAVGSILEFGANKYGDRNWEKGMEWGRIYAATLRHLIRWWSGQELDRESGYSHLWHAACNISFLIAYESRGVGVDNRPNSL